MPRGRRRPAQPAPPPTLNPNAAGIDIGATEIYVSVPFDRAPSAASGPSPRICSSWPRGWRSAG